MALPQQLKTARMANGDAANTVDDVIGALESALADIFGFTVDTDITASPFSLNNSGQITKQLVAQRAAGPVGWRMRDTTTGKEVRLAINGSDFVLDENTGSEAVPVWTNRFSMVISTGALTGAAATTSRMGLCPQGDGDNTHYLDGTLAWSTPSTSAAAACRVRHSANQSLSNGSMTTLSFDTEDFDTDTMHSTVTNSSRITCVTPGKYMVIGQVSFAANSTGTRIAQILKNGATLIARQAGKAAVANTSIETRTIIDLVAGDYVQLQAYQNSGGALNAVAAPYYAPVFSAFKIG